MPKNMEPRPPPLGPKWHVPHPHLRPETIANKFNNTALVTKEDMAMLDKHITHLVDVVKHVPRHV